MGHEKTSQRLWWTISAVWTTLILFSSTSLAVEYSERAFACIYGSTVGKHLASDEAYDWLHFFAERLAPHAVLRAGYVALGCVRKCLQPQSPSVARRKSASRDQDRNATRAWAVCGARARRVRCRAVRRWCSAGRGRSLCMGPFLLGRQNSAAMSTGASHQSSTARIPRSASPDPTLRHEAGVFSSGFFSKLLDEVA